MFGGGSYTLSSVMEIEGTEEYLKRAEKSRDCQNKEAQEECLAREYSDQGLRQCSCVPYKLRNYSNMVRTRGQLEL